MDSISDTSRSISGGFQRVVAGFLNQPGLPFASVLSAARVERVFAKHRNLFVMNRVYSTVNVLWALLGQVLRDGQEAACQAAVAAITAQRLARGLATPTADTGDDCKARAKLSEAALRELTVEIADELEVQADPKWMDQATYETIPETMLLRELRFHVSQPGRRTTEITIATTLTDAEVYTKEDIAELYGFRWNAELDIRSIKQNLNLNHLRCKSPEMVRRELWTTLLAYHLVRTTAAAAALLYDKRPRQISFTGTCQYLLASWTDLARGHIAPEKITDHCLMLLSKIAECEVAHRPGRIEPRVLKRRRHGDKLMTQPRHALKKQLESGNAKT